MNEDFSQQVLDRIERERVKPVPRFVVLARRIIAWLLLGVSALCAAFLGSLLILAVLQTDLEFLRASALGPMLRLFLDYVPALWVVLFVLFCGLEIVLLRHETHAYRYPWLAVSGFVVAAVSLAGLGLYAAKLPERIERSLQRRLPPGVHGWIARHPGPPRPEDGVLFGRVREVSVEAFQLDGPRRDRWRVTWPGRNLLQEPLLRPGQVVLVRGVFIRPGAFEAENVRAYRGRMLSPLN